MAFVNATGIAYGQKISRSLMILVVCVAVVFTNALHLRVAAKKKEKKAVTWIVISTNKPNFERLKLAP